MVEPSPPWISKLMGVVGIGVIVLIEGIVFLRFVLNLNEASSSVPSYFNSVWPMVTVVLVTIAVGVFCLWDNSQTAAPYKGIRTFRSFFICLGLTILYLPILVLGAAIAFLLYR